MNTQYTRPNPSFIIAGLPRSRTCWLANLMDYDGVTCRHEWAFNVEELDDWYGYNKGLSSRASIGGDCGTWFALLPDLRGLFPETPIVIIDTPIAVSMESLIRAGLPVDREWLEKGQRNLHDVEGALRVSRWDINERLEEIHQFCTGHTYRSQVWKDRARVLMDTTVQVAPWTVMSAPHRQGYRISQLYRRIQELEVAGT